jgi:uncharacterized damage-inducible protein DinB
MAAGPAALEDVGVSDRRPPLELTDERTMLVAYLDYLREAIVLKTQGLSDDDVRRPMVASGTSLFGLVHHLVGVERYWFHHVLAGRDIERPGEGLALDEVVAQYRAATATANEIVLAIDDMDQPSAAETFDGRRPSVRWILVHMVEETGRHAGHADIIRELIDGETGR